MIDAMNPEIIMPAMVVYEVTCRQAECLGEGIVTTITAPLVDPSISCGICHQAISDIVLVEQPAE